MLSQVRAFSSLSRVIRAPAPSVSLKNVSVADALSNNKEPAEKKKSIEEATLSLLENTVSKDKNRPLDASIQRFQKIHEEGDLYHPYDLDDNRYRENLHARRFKRNTPTEDPFDVLGLDPLKEYKNYRLLTHFVSDMGKILPREQTGVSAKNQRKLAKAIKRARAMGLMSATSNQVDFRI